MRTGRWDAYVSLAARFGWTEAQVDATDPELVAELLTFVRAERDHQAYAERTATR